VAVLPSLVVTVNVTGGAAPPVPDDGLELE